MAFFSKVGNSVLDWLHNLIDTSTISSEATATSSDTLETISQQIAVRELAVYTAVGLLADMISKCERQVISENGQPVKDDNWYRWNISPNDNQSGAELMSRIVTDMYYQGVALVVPLKDRKTNANKLYNVDSFGVDEYPVKGNVYSNITIGNLQLNKTYKADELYVFKGNGHAKSLIDKAFDPYAYLLLSAATSYQRGSGEKYVLTLNNQLPNQDQEKYKKYMDDIQNSMKSFINSANACLPLTKDKTLDRKSAGNTNSSSSDYTNLRKDAFAIVAAALHIPVGLLDGNITSVDQVVNQTLTFAVDPLASRISNELTRKTFDADDVKKGNKIVIDTSRIRHMDLTELASVADKLMATGVHCIDDNKILLGEPPLNTDWSMQHFVTKNYSSADDMDTLEGGETNE